MLCDASRHLCLQDRLPPVVFFYICPVTTVPSTLRIVNWLRPGSVSNVSSIRSGLWGTRKFQITSDSRLQTNSCPAMGWSHVELFGSLYTEAVSDGIEQCYLVSTSGLDRRCTIWIPSSTHIAV
jgi:hypothetical protein